MKKANQLSYLYFTYAWMVTKLRAVCYVSLTHSLTHSLALSVSQPFSY